MSVSGPEIRLIPGSPFTLRGPDGSVGPTVGVCLHDPPGMYRVEPGHLLVALDPTADPTEWTPLPSTPYEVRIDRDYRSWIRWATTGGAARVPPEAVH